MKLGDLQTRMWVRLKKTSRIIEPGTFVRLSGKKFNVVPVNGKKIDCVSGVSEGRLEPGQEGWIVVQGPVWIPRN